MDPRAHRRFLEYREAFGYFSRGDRKMLDRESWIAFDLELVALEARGPRAWTREEAERVKTLRRVLLRD